MSQAMVIDALRLLTPHDVAGIDKIRIGGPGDGGYVLLDCIQPGVPVMSFGIGPSVAFDQDMAERGHPVLMFDHTIDALPATHPSFTWHRAGVAAEPGPNLDTLANHMAGLAKSSTDMILKMDIEGAEWDVLSSAPTGLLARFSQITMELHDLQRLGEPDYNAKFQAALKALSDFAVVHVHANNYGALVFVGGTLCAQTLEITYIRRDLVTLLPSKTVYPTALDSPNFEGGPDHLLWFFPFLPGSAQATIPGEPHAALAGPVLHAPVIHYPLIDPPEVWQARLDLAASLRMAARLGLHEGICNHFSAMVPGRTDQFLVNRYGLAFAEATASSLLVCDFEGNVIAGDGEPEATAFFIHARLHLKHPRARVAMHTHMPYATALCMIDDDEPLRYAGQSALKFLGRTIVDRNYNGLALDTDEGDRIAASMGDADIVFLRNHGVMVVGETIAKAWDDLYYLERACEAQVLALSTGRALLPVPPEIADLTARQMRGDNSSAALHLASIRRRLDAAEPEYRR